MEIGTDSQATILYASVAANLQKEELSSQKKKASNPATVLKQENSISSALNQLRGLLQRKESNSKKRKEPEVRENEGTARKKLRITLEEPDLLDDLAANRIPFDSELFMNFGTFPKPNPKNLKENRVYGPVEKNSPTYVNSRLINEIEFKLRSSH